MAWPLLLSCVAPAAAQFGFPPAAAPAPAPSSRNQACLRLEGQLAAIDRGGASSDPAKADQIKRLEDTAAKQQAELDRVGQQSRRMGCEGSGFFSIFSGQSPQCTPLNNQTQQLRATLDRTLSDIQRLQGNSGEREAQRRGVLVALGQNDCGPQYRQYATAGGPAGFFENLFGGNNPLSSPEAAAPATGTYRTLCVRTCDGYYFPISYSTVPARFADDELVCRRMCPAAEVTLYSHHNPGEDVARAVSASGKSYSELPKAFSYRKQYDAACTCRAPGQSWLQALRPADDQTLERGDIVVTEERAKQLSQPRVDAQGRPVNLEPNSGRPGAAPRSANAAGPSSAAPLPAPAPAQTASPPAEERPEQDAAKGKIRAVGPSFYPAR
ncbi:MAG: DUF2865 domain-containing protein [Xanthobacteraceae bacterium]